MKIWLSLYLFLLPCLLFAESSAESVRQALLRRDTTQVLVVAHRADWRAFPENSLLAIESAIAMGVDIIEIDIQRTQDGHLILMHDKSIDRTTTGKGLVEELTLDSLRRVQLRNGCAIRTRHRVPTLEEALLLGKGRVLFNLDKADRYMDEVYALVERIGMTNQVIVKGRKAPAEVKAMYGDKLQKMLYMPIVSLDDPDAEETIRAFAKELNPVAFELVFRTADNTKLQAIKKLLRGKHLIWYNTLWDTLSGGYDDDTALSDPEAVYGTLIRQLGGNIIQTDRPADLLRYLSGLRAEGLIR